MSALLKSEHTIPSGENGSVTAVLWLYRLNLQVYQFAPANLESGSSLTVTKTAVRVLFVIKHVHRVFLSLTETITLGNLCNRPPAHPSAECVLSHIAVAHSQTSLEFHHQYCTAIFFAIAAIGNIVLDHPKTFINLRFTITNSINCIIIVIFVVLMEAKMSRLMSENKNRRTIHLMN